MKRILPFLLVAVVLWMAGCKKTCTFPFIQDGKGCYDTRNDFTGDYRGLIHTSNVNIGDQIILQYVHLGKNDDTHLDISGVDAALDEHSHFVVDSQIVTYNYKRYTVAGSGYFINDTLDNKVMVLDLSHEVIDTPGNSYFSHYVGLR